MEINPLTASSPDIAAVAALIADPSRAAMLSALLGGVALPAGELARAARITPQTASAHLARLVSGGLLRVVAQGRHRYYRLSSRPVAQLLESLALLAPAARVRSLRQSIADQALREARTCYDHLAGTLGVAVTQALVSGGQLIEHDEIFELSASGAGWFQSFGVDPAAAQARRSRFAPVCIDWSARQPHLGGALGAALAQRLFALGWLARGGPTRALQVTPTGRAGLQRALQIDWPIERKTLP